MGIGTRDTIDDNDLFGDTVASSFNMVSRAHKSHRKKSSKNKRTSGRSRRHAHAKSRGRIRISKRRSGKIHYARKTGQPYIILASGKAKFIKGKRHK